MTDYGAINWDIINFNFSGEINNHVLMDRTGSSLAEFQVMCSKSFKLERYLYWKQTIQSGNPDYSVTSSVGDGVL